MTNTLLFNIFIFITLLLIGGYFYGKRKNQLVAARALKKLSNLFEPDDQKIINIGGIVGYHIEMVFSKTRLFQKIEGTITLLPRHTLLYLPVSKLIRKSDRFFIRIFMKTIPVENSARLFEKKFLYKHRNNVLHENRFAKKYIKRGKTEFCYCLENELETAPFEKLLAKIDKPEHLKELSFYPDQKLVELLFIPGKAGNDILTAVADLLHDCE